MAGNQDGQEKLHEPTSKRLADARRKGQVPRSRELNTMVVSLTGSVALIFLAGHFAAGFEKLFQANFVFDHGIVRDPNRLVLNFVAAVEQGLGLLLPFFAVTAVAAVLASVALGGFNFSTEAIQPKLSKLNPIKGIKRIFSAKGLMELLKSLAKFFLIGSVTVLLLYHWSADFIRLGDMALEPAIASALATLGWAAVILTATLIVLALFDVPFQLWDHKRQLKMTQQEVREELKQTEGRPEVRSRIRQLQREMAQRRMMEQVPKADVIVTNPTHYAVALRYDADRMRAPVVVAKGADLVAVNIRRVGGEHAVPLVEAPVLARAIYYSTELEAPIPAGLYLAVAQLLAYVFQLKAYREYGGDLPQAPDSYPVPDDLRHD